MSVTDFHARPKPGSQAALRHTPLAVVDIGSNSVRLVIYEGMTRAAYVLHNEKTICAIGRSMVSTGHLDEEGISLALESLARFRQLCAGHGVRECEAVATAAARDATNGKEFIRRAEKALGFPIRVLSGEDEARIAAEGVLAGIPEADGLVADLGGGSLDMVTVKNGGTSHAVTLPFGPLRLMDAAGENFNKARRIVSEGIDDLGYGKSLKGRSLYAVGGIWRTLARVDMAQQDYPLHVLHAYTIPAGRVLKLCKVVSNLSRKSIAQMAAVPKRRAEALPYGALVLGELVEALGLDDVVISAYGLREGLFQRRLPEDVARADPLLAYAIEINERESRAPAHAEELFRWMSPLFPKESAEQRRLRQAACYLCDIGWRRHPDDRAMGAFEQVLRGAFAGADHKTRAIIATAVYYRYSGEDDFPEDTGVAGLLGAEGAVLALRIGVAARLAFALTGSVPGELPTMSLHLTERTLALGVPPKRSVLLADTVHKRLNDLASAFNRKAEAVEG